VLLIQERCVLCCTDRQTQLVYSVWVLLQNSMYFFQQIMKEPTTCFGLYRKAIIRLYIIVDLSALEGGGDEISPYRRCVGFRSLSSSVVGLFFLISITVGTRFFHYLLKEIYTIL
jgi:hypothetical protein